MSSQNGTQDGGNASADYQKDEVTSAPVVPKTLASFIAQMAAKAKREAEEREKECEREYQKRKATVSETADIARMAPTPSPQALEDGEPCAKRAAGFTREISPDVEASRHVCRAVSSGAEVSRPAFQGAEADEYSDEDEENDEDEDLTPPTVKFRRANGPMSIYHNTSYAFRQKLRQPEPSPTVSIVDSDEEADRRNDFDSDDDDEYFEESDNADESSDNEADDEHEESDKENTPHC